MQIKKGYELTRLSQELCKPENWIADRVIRFLKSLGALTTYSDGRLVMELMDNVDYPVETMAGLLGANNPWICTLIGNLTVEKEFVYEN